MSCCCHHQCGPDNTALLTEMRDIMATVSAQVDAMRVKVEEIGQQNRDILDDFRAYRDLVLAERQNPTEGGQVSLDNLSASLDARLAEVGALDTEVGEHDGLPA